MDPNQEVVEDRKSDSHSGEDKKKVEIRVNGKKVEMIGREHTGLEIKKAAIDQGVNIKLDFLLYLIREGQPNEPIGDNQQIKISSDSRFHAIADDDNS